jgi:hypothetical protein
MFSDERTITTRVVERYIMTGSTSDDQVKVICLPNDKTSLVERSGDEGRSILLDEYRVDGKAIWAGYSGRSETVYLSTVTKR